MKTVFTRPAEGRDNKQYLDWSLAGKDNGFDPDAALYGTSVTWAAYAGDRVIGYLPMQTPLVLEALAARPDATPLEIATALRELVQTAVTQCHIRGVGEIMFIGTNAETNRFAENSGLFTRVEYPVYKLKVKNLETKKD